MAQPPQNPQMGQRYTWPDGEVTEWDGQGWAVVDAAPDGGGLMGMLGMVEDVGLPMAGAFIGGKTPLGPVGSAIGAAAGEGIGELSKFLRNDPVGTVRDVGRNLYEHPAETITGGLLGMGEGARTAGLEAAGTYAGEKWLGPLLSKMPNIPAKVPGWGGIGSIGLSTINPVAGVATGLASGAAALAGPVTRGVGKALTYMGTPQGAGQVKAATEAAREQLMPGPAQLAGLAPRAQQMLTSRAEADIAKAAEAAQQQFGGVLGNADIPGALQSLGNRAMAVPRAALDGLSNAKAWLLRTDDVPDLLKPRVPPAPPAPPPSEGFETLKMVQELIEQGYDVDAARKIAGAPARSTQQRISHLPQLPDEDRIADSVKRAGAHARMQRGKRLKRESQQP